MGENPDRFSRKNRSTEGSNGGDTRNRHLVDDGAGDVIKCSGKYCRSCTASFMADCVAICCCPCAVVSFLALAFVKVPWMMGRRCLGLEKKKKKGHESEGKERREGKERDGLIERNENLRKERAMEEGKCQFQTDDETEQKENFCAGIEAESVWMELYQLGHLGFGRVSFSETKERKTVCKR
ncbi:uncharacterized protein LOC122672028 [Telopea speciosissima]|uniref:uncharacterized protein LOC122672028 n=1 Tax=Telopea speciosissima TaxID=54955 RepID=UPI001CC8236B|nr:uncharacterized protein LOC122672028 [Telopea speciosissima]